MVSVTKWSKPQYLSQSCVTFSGHFPARNYFSRKESVTKSRSESRRLFLLQKLCVTKSRKWPESVTESVTNLDH